MEVPKKRRQILIIRILGLAEDCTYWTGIDYVDPSRYNYHTILTSNVVF